MDGGEMRGHDMRGEGMRGHEMRGGGEMRGPLGRLLPEGTWWRNPELASRIGLTAEQQKRIDEIFLQSRVQLIHMHASLEEEQLLLEPLLNANPVDQARALAQIGKIADTRAELEKTDAKMLLSIRAVLSADQWTKMQDRHRGMRDGRGMGGPGGGMRGGFRDRPAPQAPPQ
jgi:Spy/CpxP family protein refolding chaperone